MVCEFHPSRLCRVRPGKRTFFEAEKFALQQGPWNRRTIHLNELAIRYCGMTMKPSRENLFATSLRPVQEHRNARSCDFGRAPSHLFHGCRPTKQYLIRTHVSALLAT